MCCIFNFMQYLFSFLHKAITAMLTCILAYAVCFVMLFAVTAGVALGYNYSVSEYMEHKDTNVSVQLQRGIFTEKEGAGLPTFRRSGGDGDGDGGQIGEKLDPGHNYPKSSLQSRIQTLDAADNYERRLEELTTENYRNFQPLINYGAVNLDQLSTDQPHVSIASITNLHPAGFAGEATAEDVNSKKESMELMRTLIDILKGTPTKDLMKVINEEVAKKELEQIAPNVNNYRIPIDLAMAANASSTTEEFDIGLDRTPMDIKIRSSSTESTKVLLFSEYTTPASVANSTSDDSLSDTDDVSSDWSQKLYSAVARLKRKDVDKQTLTRNKPNTKTKQAIMKSLFQDPSFVAGIKSMAIVPYSLLQNEMSDQNGRLGQIKTNSVKDEKDKHLKSQSEVHVHKIDGTTSLNQDSYHDYGPAPSDEEYSYDDEKSGQIAVRRKRSAPRLSKHSNKSRILTTFINTIS